MIGAGQAVHGRIETNASFRVLDLSPISSLPPQIGTGRRVNSSFETLFFFS